MDNKKKSEAALLIQESLEAINSLEQYFDQRSDADHDGDGFVPNEEMRLQHKINELQNNLYGLENIILDTYTRYKGCIIRRDGEWFHALGNKCASLSIAKTIIDRAAEHLSASIKRGRGENV